jgi:hypothetical protein
MFRKKIQNAMNRPSSTQQRRTSPAAATSLFGTARSIVGIVVVVTILLCAWCVALMTSMIQPQQQPQNPSAGGGGERSSPARVLPFTMATGTAKITTTTAATNQKLQQQRQIIQDFRARFYGRYGDAAATILQKGIRRYGDVNMTAQRLVQAANNNEPLRLSFAGYSVTVGRGNHLSESYPLVLQDLLNPLFKSTIGIDAAVTNAAIGGIPSFPYGFCFAHFLGENSDVISWDYSMNEGGGASVLEAYVRQSQVQLSRRPMLIVLDTHTKRCDLIQSYADRQWIHEGLCVGMAKHAVPNLAHYTETLDNADRPVGFRDWDQFGAPPNCPGRGNWHPKRQEHALIAWMLAMYFCDALELAITSLATTGNAAVAPRTLHQEVVPTFGEPLETPPADNDPAVTDLLYGHQQQQQGRTLKHLSCRTNFLPATNHEKVLPSIVTAGLARDAEQMDIMQERSDDNYRSGWVLDVSSVERDTKVKVEQCGGLGYVDMKIALYGIPESGPLQLWLPLEATALHDGHDHADNDDARHWFDEIIICEANEKRPAQACQLDRDVAFTVGGIAVARPTMIHGAAEYLKRPTCVHVGVPPGARITRRGDLDLKTTTTASSSSSLHQWPKHHVGLTVQITAQGPVTRANGACCISHVVWEQH